MADLGKAVWQLIDWANTPNIEAYEFLFNKASRWWDTDNAGSGGALAVFSGASVINFGVVVENSVFHDNSTGSLQGAAIFTYAGSYFSATQITNCTIANNATGGIRWDTVSPMMYNDIFWNNGLHEISPGCDDGAFVYYSDVMGGAGCEGFAGNLGDDPDDDPDFAPGTYHLEWDSPCIGAANPAAAPLTDLDGEYRDLEPDMGAYEFFPEDEE